jgi:hypothetical protein
VKDELAVVKMIGEADYLTGAPAQFWAKSVFALLEKPLFEAGLLLNVGLDPKLAKSHLGDEGRYVFVVSDWHKAGSTIATALKGADLLPHAHIVWYDQAELIFRSIYPPGAAPFDLCEWPRKLNEDFYSCPKATFPPIPRYQQPDETSL